MLTHTRQSLNSGGCISRETRLRQRRISACCFLIPCAHCRFFQQEGLQQNKGDLTSGEKNRHYEGVQREGVEDLAEGMVFSQCGSSVCLCKDNMSERKKNAHAMETDDGWQEMEEWTQDGKDNFPRVSRRL